MGKDSKMVTKAVRAILTLVLLTSTLSAQVQFCGVDSAQRTLVNNLIRSEELDNAAYTLFAGLTIAANNVIAPDGTTTAETLTATATTNQHRFGSTSVTNRPSATAGQQWTISTHARAGTHGFIAVGDSGDDVVRTATVNLSTCTSTLSTNINGVTTESLPDGWCRIVVTLTRTSVCGGCQNLAADTFIVQNGSMAGGTSWLAAGTETVALWGMAAQRTTAPSTYIRTTDTQVTAGLANTVAQVTERNDIQRSEEFDNAFYTKSNSSITANVASAPNGTLSADRYAETATTATHSVFNASPITSFSDYRYRHGLYVKPETGITWVSLIPQYSGVLRAWFNIVTCTVGTVEAGITARAVRMNDNWCYIEAIRTSNSTSSYWQIFSHQSDGQTAAFLGSVSNTMLIWGALLNPAASPPDYIPTTSAAATLSGVCPAGTSQSLNDPSRCFAVRDNRVRRW